MSLTSFQMLSQSSASIQCISTIQIKVIVPTHHFVCFLTIFDDAAVGGCGYKEADDPGNLQFDWLEVQLKSFRSRGMHVSNRFAGSSSRYHNELIFCASGMAHR